MSVRAVVEIAGRVLALADGLGIDPVELRRRNIMPDDGYPAVTASGIRLKDLSHERCIDALVEHMRYAELRREQAELRERGIHRGIGIACFILALVAAIPVPLFHVAPAGAIVLFVQHIIPLIAD